ncbi:MAG: acylphosphatase [Planctomycetes bacterium]|nr:acylphosphatase [Planctomycetota bacterium]
MDDAAALRRCAFTVRGRVQGVAFRASAAREAVRLGVTGFVGNEWDGSVRGEAQGPEDALDRFVVWLHAGPPWARVDDVEVHEAAVRPAEDRFVVLR